MYLKPLDRESLARRLRQRRCRRPRVAHGMSLSLILAALNIRVRTEKLYSGHTRAPKLLQPPRSHSQFMATYAAARSSSSRANTGFRRVAWQLFKCDEYSTVATRLPALILPIGSYDCSLSKLAQLDQHGQRPLKFAVKVDFVLYRHFQTLGGIRNA